MTGGGFGPGGWLLSAVLASPVVGFEQHGPPVAHKVDRDALIAAASEWATVKTVTAVCGQQVKLVLVDTDGGTWPASWMDLRTRGTGVTRCRTCRSGAGS